MSRSHHIALDLVVCLLQQFLVRLISWFHRFQGITFQVLVESFLIKLSCYSLLMRIRWVFLLRFCKCLFGWSISPTKVCLNFILLDKTDKIQFFFCWPCFGRHSWSCWEVSCMKSVWHNNTFLFHADILTTYRSLFNGTTGKSTKYCQLWIILNVVLLHLLRLYAKLLLARLFSTMAIPILATCRTQAKGSFLDVIEVSLRSGRGTRRYAGLSCIYWQSIPTSALDSNSAYSFLWCLWSHPKEFPNSEQKKEVEK